LKIDCIFSAKDFSFKNTLIVINRNIIYILKIESSITNVVTSYTASKYTVGSGTGSCWFASVGNVYKTIIAGVI